MKLSSRYMPKSDRALLVELNERAWQKVNTELFESRRAEVGEALARHLEAMYPTEDMALLARYNCTMDRQECHVQIRTPDSDRWEEHTSVALPRRVTVASSYHGLFCGGPRWAEMENRGVNDETRQEIEAGGYGGWEAFCADQDRREQERVPRELEPFFFDIVTWRRRYLAEYIASWQTGRSNGATAREWVSIRPGARLRSGSRRWAQRYGSVQHDHSHHSSSQQRRHGHQRCLPAPSRARGGKMPRAAAGAGGHGHDG